MSNLAGDSGRNMPGQDPEVKSWQIPGSGLKDQVQVQSRKAADEIKAAVKRGHHRTVISVVSDREVREVHRESAEKSEGNKEPQVQFDCEKAHQKAVRSLIAT